MKFNFKFTEGQMIKLILLVFLIVGNHLFGQSNQLEKAFKLKSVDRLNEYLGDRILTFNCDSSQINSDTSKIVVWILNLYNSINPKERLVNLSMDSSVLKKIHVIKKMPEINFSKRLYYSKDDIENWVNEKYSNDSVSKSTTVRYKWFTNPENFYLSEFYSESTKSCFNWKFNNCLNAQFVEFSNELEDQINNFIFYNSFSKTSIEKRLDFINQRLIVSKLPFQEKYSIFANSDIHEITFDEYFHFVKIKSSWFGCTQELLYRIDFPKKLEYVAKTYSVCY